jgi:Tol biopolymer transport system component
MVEAEETYRALSAKARRATTDAFTAHWSPDGKKLAFSLGVHGYNGVALFDPATRETDLLIAPGKDPVWSPDGQYIAFVRDCRQVPGLPELATAQRRDQDRSGWDEEVWLIKADGTQARRLVHGHWPSWSQDSQCVYYQSPEAQALCSISLTDPDGEPKSITPCSNLHPALSPDGQRLAYMEGGLFKVKDLTSQTSVAEWKGPFAWWGGGMAWSPKGDELCVGGNTSTEKRAGLWICRFDRPEPVKILDGEVDIGSWSPEGTKLVFTLGPPFFEVWIADLDPNASIVAGLGPAQTIDEHYQELADLWTRRIAADPANASNYAHRARHYQSLREEAKARADTRRYQAALSPGWPAYFGFAGPWTLMCTIDGPFAYQLTVFVERQEDGMQLLRVAFGQKGKCQMKSVEMPMALGSLVGLCSRARPEIPAAPAGLAFGKPQNLRSTVNSAQRDDFPVLSRDGLELYFMSERPGGYGRWDIWMSKRAHLEDPWEPPVNLGAGINSAGDNVPGSISSDGLTLYLFATTGFCADLYTATRPARDAPWGPRVNMGPVLNRPDEDGGYWWGNDAAPIISPDDLELFFMSWRPGAIGLADLYVSERTTPADPWGPPRNLGPAINTAGTEGPTAISPDGLVLFIAAENRRGGFGGFDAWMIRRPSKGAAWSEPVNLGPSFNTPGGESLGSLSPDGKWCYFAELTWAGVATRPTGYGGSDLWMAPVTPLMDFNGDGKVDAADLAVPPNNRGKPPGR